MNWLWLLLPVILAVAGFAIWSAAKSPVFWVGLVRAIVKAALPSIAKAVKPKDFTPEQRKQMDAGEEPTLHPRFPKRPGSGGSS